MIFPTMLRYRLAARRRLTRRALTVLRSINHNRVLTILRSINSDHMKHLSIRRRSAACRRSAPHAGRRLVLSRPATLTPAATLACPIVSALDRWVSDGVQPAAMRWFGEPVAEIKQISAYSCRGMVGAGGSGISEHAFGNALDIAAFTFSDGRRVTVQRRLARDAGRAGVPRATCILRPAIIFRPCWRRATTLRTTIISTSI